MKPSQVLYFLQTVRRYAFWAFDKLSGLNFKAAP